MLNFKIIIGFAAFALFITLVGGMAGAVPIGMVMLRALLGVIAFTGLGAGVSWLIKKYLPDLVEPRSAGAEKKEEGDANPGAEVNIVLPEENPHTASGSANGGESGATEDEAQLDGSAGGGLDDVSERSEVEELNSASSDTQAAGEAEVSDMEESPEAAELDGGYNFSRIENMPGFQAMEGNFEIATGGGTRDNAGPSGTINVMGQEQDAATTAKAIQTWLKKDQEG